MADTAKLNARHPAVKRIMQEIRELQSEDSPDYKAEALESNIFEWHFAIRGPPDTEFQGGIFHGRILLPSEYPFKPPEFILLTPNGRWETNTKICLSISSHHPEHWQPSWSVRTALLALIAFMPSPSGGAIGSLDFPKSERKRLAALSQTQPPKFGTADRQEVTTAVHARMLAVSRPQGLKLTATQNPTASAQQPVPVPIQLASTGISNADLAAAHKEAAARRARSRAEMLQPKGQLQNGGVTNCRDSEAQNPARGSGDIVGFQTAERNSDLPAARDPQEQQTAAMSGLQAGSTQCFKSLVLGSNWEERAINFLVIAILVAILAILGRKALAGTDIAESR